MMGGVVRRTVWHARFISNKGVSLHAGNVGSSPTFDSPPASFASWSFSEHIVGVVVHEIHHHDT
jgi:hypothetical protein